MEKRRLTAKEILDYAQGSGAFFRDGRYVLPEEMMPEEMELQRDWSSLHSMETALSRLRAAEAREEGKGIPELWKNPGQRVVGFHEKDLRKSGELPPRAIFLPPEGVYFSHPVRIGGEEVFLETSKEQSADDLRRNALELVSAKMAEYAPRARYVPILVFAHPALRVERIKEEPFLFAVWDTVRQLFTGEIDARQCRHCGKWEIKGSGFKRKKWEQHEKCSSRVRGRAHSQKVKEREQRADNEFAEGESRGADRRTTEKERA